MRHFIIAALAVIGLAGAAWGQTIPEKIGFQGRLTDATGNPISGSANLTFKLYTAGGEEKWSSGSLGVTLNGGLYSVQLGDTAMSALPFNEPYHLGIQVESDDEMTPRYSLLAAPYATRAKKANDAEKLDGKAASVYLDLAQHTGTLSFARGGTGATSFAAGSVIFSTGVMLAEDNANLFWDDTNNRLGIGTTTPTGALHVSTSDAFGVYSSTTSTSGRGVYGYASAATGQAYGVYARSESTSGYGVYGIAPAATGLTFGVYGWSNSTQGTGVYGHANATSGAACGVSGLSYSTSGRGIFGDAGAATGTTYGVYGQSSSTDGRGVYGWASAASGGTYGVYGEATSSGGWGLYTPNRLYAGGSVGIGTTSPGRPLDVASSGGIRIDRSEFASSANELFFTDNGQIRSVDDNHRILFDRGNNILELREFGDIVFSPGATTGARTQAVTLTASGRVGIGTAAPATALDVNGTVKATEFSGPLTGNVTGNATTATNAETLDSLHAASFLRSDASSALTSGTLTLNTGTTLSINGALSLPSTGITGAGSGSGMNADLLDGLHSSGFATSAHNHDAAYWKLGGNAVGTTGVLGTTDNQPLELLVNSTRALRLEPNTTSPNIAGGYAGNSITAGVFGATINGGGMALDGYGNPGLNRVTDHFGVIGGGANNMAGNDTGALGDAPYATVGGGILNRAIADRTTVGGGLGNTASGAYATIGGGYQNTASGVRSAVGGGHGNAASNYEATVGGGGTNTASGIAATVGGGSSNTASGYSSAVGGGELNNSAGDFSFAAGRQAKAIHDGAFVWADSTASDFSSTAANEFATRATGGVRFVTKLSPLTTFSIAPSGNVNVQGTLTASSFTGSASGLTGLPAGQISGVLPIANGGTNSGAALSGSSILVSNGSAIVQGAAGTTTTVLHGNAAGLPTYGPVAGGDLASNIAITTSGSIATTGTGSISSANGLTVSGGGAAITGHVLPGSDNLYDLGSDAPNPVLRWHNQYLGPGSLHLVSLADETGPGSPARKWSLGINAAGDLSVGQGGSEKFKVGDDGTVNATSFSGSGAGLTNLPANQLTLSGDVTGTANSNAIALSSGNHIVSALNDAVTTSTINDTKLATISTPGKVLDSALSPNVALLDRAGQTFTAANTFGAAGTALSVTNTAAIGAVETASVGTTAATALELKVNNARVLRLEPNATSPNIIGGNNGNSVTAGVYGATIAGGGGGAGLRNRVTNNFGTVGGGESNTASINATVGGGYVNNASSNMATVGGGGFNTASGIRSTVGGGYNNTASGYYATVPGGYLNTAGGDYSLAAGRRAKIDAPHAGAFVWADSTDADFASTAANEFASRATGGVRFVTGIDGSGNPTAGVQVAAGGGSWSSISDRNAKEYNVAVNGRDVLDRLAAIPIETWNYKSQNVSTRHIGPMAQDFKAAFGVGEDDKHITTVDADGVALAAIQGLYQVVKEKDAKIAALEARLEALERAMAK